MNLSPKQKLFCENYVLNGYDAYQAYLSSGYSVKNENTARSSASRLLTNVNIQYYIRTLENNRDGDFVVSKEDILKELAKLAFHNLDDLVEVEHGAFKLKSDVDPSKRRQALAGLSNISGSVSYSKDGQSKSFSIANKDRIKALELIARMTGVLDGGTDKGDGKPAISKVLESLRNLKK